MHAVFIIDLYSRLIAGWGLSNTGDTELRKRRIRQGMTGPRSWKDNVLVVRFIWRIKNEWSRLHEWTCGSQARREIAVFLRYYNFVRDHGAVGRTPAEAHGLSNEFSSAQRVHSSC